MQVTYLIFITIIVFQKGLLGSIEMSSLKNAIHLEHHHSLEESNVIATSNYLGKDNTSQGNAFFSFMTNCI